MERTVRLRLQITTAHDAALRATTAQFTTSFNHVCAVGWQQRNGNAYTLHHLTYHDCKTANPALVSDLHIQARQKASEAVKAAVTREKHALPTRCPQSVACPPRYNVHTFRVDWAQHTVNLATTQGRMSIPFTLPAYAAYAQGYPVTTADLLHRHGRWCLHVVVQLPDMPWVDNGTALGVDLGVTHPAVTSDNRFHGRRHWREVTRRRCRLQRKLQSNGSKAAKRHLRHLAGREQRFRRDCDHVLSTSIVSTVEPGTTIVIENLTNIRKRVKARRGEAKRRLHAWSCAQLKGFLEYKAAAQGCRVVAVDPRHSSQRCHRCGFTARGNRPDQSTFRCRSCGYRHNADLNAAKNLRNKHLVGWASSPASAPPSSGVSSHPLG